MSEFANGVSKLELSREDIAKAVEFWLNAKVLKVPCEVTSMAKTDSQFSYGVFEVVLHEKESIPE